MRKGSSPAKAPPGRGIKWMKALPLSPWIGAYTMVIFMQRKRGMKMTMVDLYLLYLNEKDQHMAYFTTTSKISARSLTKHSPGPLKPTRHGNKSRVKAYCIHT